VLHFPIRALRSGAYAQLAEHNQSKQKLHIVHLKATDFGTKNWDQHAVVPKNRNWKLSLWGSWHWNWLVPLPLWCVVHAEWRADWALWFWLTPGVACRCPPWLDQPTSPIHQPLVTLNSAICKCFKVSACNCDLYPTPPLKVWIGPWTLAKLEKKLSVRVRGFSKYTYK